MADEPKAGPNDELDLDPSIGDIPRSVACGFGAPGVIIGLLSLVSFGFGLVVLVGEYHRPIETARLALHRIFGGWSRFDDNRGGTLADHAEQWRTASPGEKSARQILLRKSLHELGEELTRHDAQFRMIRVVALDLGPAGGPTLANWRPGHGPAAGVDETTDRVSITESDHDDGHGPAVELAVCYRVAPEVSDAFSDVESSYHRLLLALLGLSGNSLFCLAYMVLHARAQRERVAREAASAATLDLADRTCHELGNVAFVVANERRNLASHIDLLDRFVTEDAEAHAEAARRSGLDPAVAARFDHALRREYAERGIDPEFELRGSATIARAVCRQIAVCSDYIALTVRELDGYLKRSSLPVEVAALSLGECVDDALALLAPRLEASDALIERPEVAGPPIKVQADRRLLIHALVNLIKNAVEASTASGFPPLVKLSIRVEGSTVWLTVADNGPGIPAVELRKVFDAGYTTKGNGRGLGLAIVRESIAVQGGEITVSSEGGTGTEFRIGLVLA